ncbi:MAG: phenylacetate--CoA ligase family protein [Burkholderiales bacterium]|nr:phenylacetate--CoA ligase family protein [Burkholderiales bacterium]
MAGSHDDIRSAVPGVRWPAIPARGDARALATRWQCEHARKTPLADDTALLLALQWQFERSEWSAPEDLQSRQLAQVDALCAHAWEEVPFYRERLAAAGYRPAMPLSWPAFRAIPVLGRSEVQAAGATLRARSWPPQHGRSYREATSGSTAEPIEFTSTEIVKVMWHAFTLREHLWHRRDFGSRLAAIRSVIDPGDYADWGLPATLLGPTGPAFGLRVSTPVPEQLAWIAARDPEYLITYPSNLAALARESAAGGTRPTRLRETRTFGERLPAGLREAVQRAWNVPLVDMYSAQEVGYIAFQCPQHAHYHVQSEGVLVEVLDELGSPCPPGTIGRVVVTSLHNFATPFIRYELGDYAVTGEPCPCGRGLPVLGDIVGRARNMAIRPDGSRFWPRIRPGEWAGAFAVKQFRLVQTAPDAMRLEVVTLEPLQAEQTAAIADGVARRLGHPFDITVVRVDHIARGAGEKLDDFVCQLER